MGGGGEGLQFSLDGTIENANIYNGSPKKMGRLGQYADLRGDLVKQEGAGVLKC